MGCHSLLQWIFPTQGSSPGLLCLLIGSWIFFFFFFFYHWHHQGNLQREKDLFTARKNSNLGFAWTVQIPKWFRQPFLFVPLCRECDVTCSWKWGWSLQVQLGGGRCPDWLAQATDQPPCRSLVGTLPTCHGLSWWLKGKESACSVGDTDSTPELRRFPGEGHGKPTPVFLPGESHGQRNLVGYGPMSHKKSDMTEHVCTQRLYTNIKCCIKQIKLDSKIRGKMISEILQRHWFDNKMTVKIQEIKW